MKLYRTSNGNYVEEDGSYYRVPESTSGTRSLRTRTCKDICARSSAGQARDRFCLGARLWRRSAPRKCGPPALRTTAAAARAWRKRRTPAAATSTIAFIRPSVRSCSSKPRPAAWPRRRTRPHRSDSKWNVPEPELTLLINPRGQIIGYTVGNDMSSRDIEGENPLYLPQAKVYDRSCALGPCILFSAEPLPPTTPIRIEILRGGRAEFSGATTLAELKRDPTHSSRICSAKTLFPPAPS